MFVGPWTSLNFHFLYDRSSDIMMFTEVHRATRVNWVPFGNQITKGGNGGSPASCFWSRNSWLVIISMYPIKFHYSKFHWYPINIPLNSMCIPLISHEYTMSYPMNIPCHIPLNVVKNPCFHGAMSVKSPFIIRMTEDMSIKSLPRIIAESRGKDIEALPDWWENHGWNCKNWTKTGLHQHESGIRVARNWSC